MRSSWYVAALAAVMVSVSCCRTSLADLILVYSNMSAQSPLFNWNGGYGIYGDDFGGSSDSKEAVSFTPTVTTDFDYACMPVDLINAASHQATVTLCQDNHGVPGATIESISVVPPLNNTDSDAYATAVSSLTPQLTAGSTYWLVASTSGDNSALWKANNTGDVTSDPGSGFAWTTSPGDNWYSASGFAPNVWTRPAFFVYGTSVPEPACLGLAAFALGLLRRPRRSC